MLHAFSCLVGVNALERASIISTEKWYEDNENTLNGVNALERASIISTLDTADVTEEGTRCQCP